MSKSKLSKRQIAGALLLSSTVIGATASGTASANFMDFMNTIGSVAGKVGNFVSGHAWGVAKEGFSALVFCSLILLACSIYLKEGGDAINQDTVLSDNIKKFSENIKKFIEKINKKLEKKQN